MTDRESIVAWLRAMSQDFNAPADWRECYRVTAICIESKSDLGFAAVERVSREELLLRYPEPPEGE